MRMRFPAQLKLHSSATATNDTRWRNFGLLYTVATTNLLVGQVVLAIVGRAQYGAPQSLRVAYLGSFTQARCNQIGCCAKSRSCSYKQNR